MAEALQVGVAKYSRYNYCAGMEASRVIAALLRHATDWFEGEETDKEDGQHHLGAVMACAAMLLRQQELGTMKDDRYPLTKPGYAVEVTRRASGRVVSGHVCGTYEEAVAYGSCFDNELYSWQIKEAP